MIDLKAIRALFEKYREAIAYVFFGGLTTLVNLAAYWLLSHVGAATVPATVLATAISIVFAYFTNRRWVFESRARGAARWREFASFVGCRLSTLALDALTMWIGVDLLGARFASETSMDAWSMGMKLFANVLVIVVNYALSKLIVFRKSK